jgi:uncharacterized protein (DUF2141 family)
VKVPTRAGGPIGRSAIALSAALFLIHGAARADLPACEGSGAKARLTVVVEGVRSSAGLIAVTLYPDDSSRFLVHKGQIGILRTPATAGVTSACLALPDAGVYAVAVYHDANGDHRLNRNAIGMPSEAWGFSNNPPTILSLPAFKAVRFRTQAGDNTIRIRLHYPGGKD